ncbi:uncharacterized protein DNG_08518 [Cephalotrichum gorgonifer]|uniref:Uncharacterized protein n=1 Tax=Cephalotrichum gorgonifer TaxID=2041049 RepID=A0AAE8N3P1_9PEZI|nr:uncharacterized protein DNG_08518 [Cephalotrichum gorgonifer]
MAACQEDKHPYEIVVNGTTGPVLLPSPPSTVSSADTPRKPLVPSPGSTNNNNNNNNSNNGDGAGKNKKNKNQKRPQQQQQQQQRVRRPTLPQSAVFAPRPVQDLLVERAYLVDSLAAQGARASELVRLLAAAERAAAESEAAAGANANGGRRRLRRRVSLLKSKIAVAADQEKAVIVRLGELYVEMQSRERWARVRLETGLSEGYFPPVPMHSHLHMQMQMPMPVPLPVVPFQVAPPRVAPLQEAAPVVAQENEDLSGMSISTGLSPESPEFVSSLPRWGNPWPMPDPTQPEKGELTPTKGPR